jgi:hypothetical protein
MALCMSKTWALRKWVLKRWVLRVEATKFLQMHIRSLSQVRMAGHVLRSFQSWRESAQHSLEVEALLNFKAMNYSHRNVWLGCQERRGQAVFRNRVIFAAFWQWSEGIGGHDLNGTNRFLCLSDKEDPGGGELLELPALQPQVLTLLALLVQKYKY